jgi:hypothetical protein
MYKKYKVGIYNLNILKRREYAINKTSDMLQIPLMGLTNFFYVRKYIFIE